MSKSAEEIFISYKTGKDDGLTNQAVQVHDVLEAAGFSVWMDRDDLEAGKNWNEQIYNQIADSQVLVLVLARATAASVWVRREVDVAKGARVAVLPVLIRNDFDDEVSLQAALDKFDLSRTQFVDFTQASKAQKERLIKEAEKLREETKINRRTWLDSLVRTENKAMDKRRSRANKRHRRYVLPMRRGPQNCSIYLAAGDMTRMRDIDVLVNTENDRMQMARFFENKTLSSMLRVKGSSLRRGHVYEDTVQQDLYLQTLLNPNKYGIPQAMGQVVPTHAGHSESILIERGARYIFHAVAVSITVRNDEKDTIPIAFDQIEDVMRNCLNMIKRVNRAQGVISPKDTERREQEEANKDSYAPIRSIVFPMFGTGHGGREDEIDRVATRMIQSIDEYLSSEVDEHFSVTDIHLSAFSNDDVKTIGSVMDRLLERIED